MSCPLESRSRRWLRAALALPAIVLVWGLAACGSDVPIEDKYPIERLPGDSKARYENPSSVFGQGGLFGNSDQGKTGDQGGGVLGVNSLLWRAPPDNLSFLPPVSSASFSWGLTYRQSTPPPPPPSAL